MNTSLFAAAQELERVVALALENGVHVFDNRADANRPEGYDFHVFELARGSVVQPLVGATYDRVTFTGPDLAVMLKQLEMCGFKGDMIVLPTGFKGGDQFTGYKVTVIYSSYLVADENRGHILVLDSHSSSPEWMHITVARNVKISV